MSQVRKPIDATDWQILAILQLEGKATYADLARRVGLSQAAAHERVKKLESRGLIRGYRAVVDTVGLGMPVTAFIFVQQAGGPRRPDLPALFAEHPNVVECHSIAGDESYLLKVRVAETVQLERLINDIRDVETVERTRTIVGLTTWFEGRPVLSPVAEAVGGADA
jgi:Lrp/AsnC family leucine-responsive transcriptional regulator